MARKVAAVRPPRRGSDALERARIAAILLLGQGLGRGSQAIYSVIMVRELSKAGYGDMATVLASCGVLVAVGDLGFSRLIIRDAARAHDRTMLAREMLRVRAGGVLVVVGLLALAGVAGAVPGGELLGLAGAFYLFAEGLSYGYEAAAAGVERPSRFAAVQGVGGVAVAVAAVAVLSQDHVTPAGAAFGLASASAVKALAHWALWRWRGALGPSRRLRDLPVRQWLRDALPFLALMVLAAVYYRAGILILHLSRGSEETAPYAAAMRVFDGVVVLGGVVFAAVSPALSRMHRERPNDLWRVWRRMIAVFACGVVPAAVTLMLVGEQFARVVFGPRYAVSAGDVLTALAPGMALAILQQISASVVFMSDDRGAVLRLTAFNVSVLFALLVVLTNTSGAHGAAVAMSAAELLSFTTFSLLVWLRHGRGVVAPA
ncbi:MAG: hypothetical protein QOI48_4502 [Solirubrobacteraceae bacterium]|jgi:O-antigen/teichoic acid export membrane protein|nr:hypothetical protein [Solirubrobacteraceae bacterium]